MASLAASTNPMCRGEDENLCGFEFYFLVVFFFVNFFYALEIEFLYIA